MGDDELVTIATYRTLGEAHIVRGALESEGIESVLTDENSAGTYAGAIGVRLQVHAGDRARALEILSSEEAEPDDANPQDQKVCPRCGSTEIRFVTGKLFSFDSTKLEPHWECDQCRARWVVEPD